MASNRRAALYVLSALSLLSANSLLAQGGPLSLEFSFSNPGARSMALGGAFAALADDATAAFANPAGLVQLARMEVSAEARWWSYSTTFTEGGRLLGEPTGIGLDESPGLRFSRTSEDLSDLSFLSFVYPAKKWSFAVYRHQLARFESLTETQGFFFDIPGAGPPPIPARTDDFRRRTRLDITTFGMAAGFRLTERLSFGLGASILSADVLVRTEQFDTLPVTLPEGLFGRNVYDPSALQDAEDVTSDDQAMALSAGLLWQLSQRWNFGASYRQGPSVTVLGQETTGPAARCCPPGIVLDSDRDEIQLPDVVALGVAFRSAGGRWKAAFEWSHVGYSSILKSIDRDNADTNVIELDDGNELRAGFEAVLIESSPIVALRIGAWLDPDHKVSFERGNLLDQAIFRPGNDEIHVTGGVGLVFRTFQIDLGLDFSDLVDTASISAIYSF